MINDYKYRVFKIKNNPCWKRWIIIVLLILIILKLLFFTPTNIQPKQKTVTALITTKDSDKNYKYTFYYTLPNESELVINDDEINIRNREQLFKQNNKTRYNIQAGSFKSPNEAIKRQKQINSHGFNAILEKKKSGSTIWNRVKLGPYSIAEVKKIKEKLQSQEIDVMVIEIR